MLTTEQLQEISASDCNLYYSNTYVRAKMTGTTAWRWYVADSFDNSGKNLTVNLSCSGKAFCALVKDWDLDFQVPKARVYNFREHTTRLWRTAHRQNHKGLCNETYGYYDVLAPFYRFIPDKMVTRNVFSLETSNLDTLFEESSKHSFQEDLLRILKHQSLSKALDDNMILSQGVSTKNPTIWFRTLPIGEFCLRTDRALVKVPEFASEVIQTFGSIGIPVAASI